MGSLLSFLHGGSNGESAPSHSAENTRVQTFHSSPRWHLYFKEIKDSSKLVVIDFSASWCGPCKFIEPAIHGMSQSFTDVDFVNIDVDELTDVAEEYEVQAMPTFVLLKKGKEIDKVVGAKKDELENKIKKYRAA